MANNNELLKEKLVKEYPENTQKFLFWLDGVESFAPDSIKNLCTFIHTSIEHDPNPVEVLLVLGSILHTLIPDDVNLKYLKSISEHIEILYPDNNLNVKIEDLDMLQTIRSGVNHWIEVVRNPILGDKKFIDPPSIKILAEMQNPTTVKEIKK